VTRPRLRHFCPGPVDVHPEIARAMAEPTMCHREPEFSDLLEAVQGNALAVAGADPDRFAALVITGSGTAANEAVLCSAVHAGGRVLVPSTGEFGERLARISRCHATTVVLQQSWGSPMDLVRLERAMQDRRPTLVAMVHHETSTGVLNPVEEVGALCRRFGAGLFVDMVSSFSADPLDLEAAGVTFATTSSGKAIASHPGLGLVIGRRRALENLPARPAASHYLDLRRYFEFATTRRQTPNTPAVPLVRALGRALELALEEGLTARQRRLNRLAAHVREKLGACGLRALVEGQPRSCVLTSALVPPGVTYDELADGLRQRGFVIYGGKGSLEGRIFQVCTIGEITENDIDAFFDALLEVVPTGQDVTTMGAKARN